MLLFGWYNISESENKGQHREKVRNCMDKCKSLRKKQVFMKEGKLV